MMLRKMLVGVVGVLAVALLVLGGLSFGGHLLAQTHNNTNTTQGNATISAFDAEAAALAANPNSTVVETELEHEDGLQAYEVELSNGAEVKVDAATGEVIATSEQAGDSDESGEEETLGEDLDEQTEEDYEADDQEPADTDSIHIEDSEDEGMDGSDESDAWQTNATISAADAEATALAANPGTSVVETELEHEDGLLVYEVELSNGVEVKVDAGTGEILRVEAVGLDSESTPEGQETTED